MSKEKLLQPISNREEKSAFKVAAIGLSVAIWPIAFNLGGVSDDFYNHLFSILAASIAIFMTHFLLGRERRESRTIGLGRMIVFALPSIWLCVEIFSHGQDSSAVLAVRYVLSLATGLISLPFIAYFLAVHLVPGFSAITSRHLHLSLVFIILLVAVLAFASGVFHNYILSCEDFRVAGSLVPDECWSGK